MVEVWHVRHGERADEISGPEKLSFKQSLAYREGRWYDPPLTRRGHLKATEAGRFLNSLSFNHPFERARSGFDTVYCSPLLRAVQTAFCVSRQLGGLPLQVVPGLGSCTAALVRIGYDNAITMSDADIRDAFPGIDLLPRDPTAPTSFGGACAWLAGRTGRARILAVGHREGMKGMAARRVPTPHCCIGIFHAEQSETITYRMQDLLSHVGVSLSTGELFDDTVQDGNSHDESSLWDALLETANGSPPDAFLTGDRWLRREMRGSISRQVTEPQTVARRSKRNTTSSSHPQEVKETSDEKKPKAKTRRPSKPSRTHQTTRGPKGKTTEVPKRGAMAGGQSVQRLPIETVRVGGRHEEHNVHSATCATNKTSNGSSRRFADGDGKPAGCGFRVAALARASSGRASNCPAAASLTGVGPDILGGPTGVLSFLHARELGVAQLCCKAMATAAESDWLWRNVYLRLPSRLRSRTEAAVAEGATQTDEEMLHKAKFVTAVGISWKSRALRAERKIYSVRRRLGPIDGLRPSVHVLNTSLAVRLGGKPRKVVASLGSRIEGWASRANVLSEPSIRNGMRMFYLSSSVKVDVPPAMTVSQLSSVCVTLSRPDNWLAGAALFGTLVESPSPSLLPSHARLLTRSGDDSILLYELFSSKNDKSYLAKGNGSDGVCSPPISRSCVLLGVLSDSRKSGDVQRADDTAGVAFLSIHFPHQLMLDAATRQTETDSERRRSQAYGDDAAGVSHGLERFSAALGLRTAGVPVWEMAASGVNGYLCPPRQQHAPPHEPQRQPRSSGNPCQTSSAFQNMKYRSVICIELVGAGCKVVDGGLSGWPSASAAPAADRPSAGSTTLSAGPHLPFSTSGALSGVFEDVLLADFALCDEHGDSMWAFTSPIVFDQGRTSGDEASSPHGAVGRMGAGGDDGVVNIAHSEVRDNRRRGVVEEPGVGRVIVELALVNLDEPCEGGTWQQQKQQNAAGYDLGWMVRVALVELELGFIDVWFGTKHAEDNKNSSR